MASEWDEWLKGLAQRITEEIFSTPMGSPLTSDGITLAVLRGNLLPLLEAGQAMRDIFNEAYEPDLTGKLPDAKWDAAREAALKRT